MFYFYYYYYFYYFYYFYYILLGYFYRYLTLLLFTGILYLGRYTSCLACMLSMDYRKQHRHRSTLFSYYHIDRCTSSNMRQLEHYNNY